MDQHRANTGEIARRLGLRAPAASSDADLSAPGDAALPRAHRDAAVLVPLRPRGGALHVTLTRRCAHLKHHPGQIAFPGGKIDPTDASPEAAALREAEEEIGLPRAEARLLGRLGAHRTVTGFSIVPFLAEIPAGFVPVPQAGEVDEVFEVPLAHLLDPANLQIHHRTWAGARRRYYVIPYGPYYIWGATARIIKALADCLDARP